MTDKHKSGETDSERMQERKNYNVLLTTKVTISLALHKSTPLMPKSTCTGLFY